MRKRATSSRKWRFMVKNAKVENSDLSLNTYVQCVEVLSSGFWLLGILISSQERDREGFYEWA